MYDDGDYGGIDEFMYWVTIVILFLMTVVLVLPDDSNQAFFTLGL